LFYARPWAAEREVGPMGPPNPWTHQAALQLGTRALVTPTEQPVGDTSPGHPD
jgi:hypothetical protein